MATFLIVVDEHVVVGVGFLERVEGRFDIVLFLLHILVGNSPDGGVAFGGRIHVDVVWFGKRGVSVGQFGRRSPVNLGGVGQKCS